MEQPGCCVPSWPHSWCLAELCTGVGHMASNETRLGKHTDYPIASRSTCVLLCGGRQRLDQVCVPH